MPSIIELIKHQGELDLDNHLQELLNQLINVLKKELNQDIPIKKICQNVQPQVMNLRIGMLQWFATRSETEMADFNKYIEGTKLESKKFPQLAEAASLCLQLHVDMSGKHWSPSGLQKLADNPIFEKILKNIKDEESRNMYVESARIASFHFETCCIVSDMIISNNISKSPEWISELIDYLQITFVINTALAMQWEVFQPEKELVRNTPILNRAKILKADIAMFGAQNIYHLIA